MEQFVVLFPYFVMGIIIALTTFLGVGYIFNKRRKCAAEKQRLREQSAALTRISEQDANKTRQEEINKRYLHEREQTNKRLSDLVSSHSSATSRSRTTKASREQNSFPSDYAVTHAFANDFQTHSASAVERNKWHYDETPAYSGNNGSFGGGGASSSWGSSDSGSSSSDSSSSSSSSSCD